MKITIELDQKAMNKSRKFIYFQRENETDINSTRYTLSQTETVLNAFSELGIETVNNSGLNFK